jgi:HEAT repeat protein
MFGKKRKLNKEFHKLTAELRDANITVRLNAAKTLDDLGWQPDNSEVGAAYWIVKRQWDRCVVIGTPAVRPLLDYFENPTLELDRKDVVKVLGQIGDPQGVEPLIAALKDKDKWLRMAAAEYLGKIGDVRAVEALVGILEDESPGVRRRATEALDQIGWRPDQNKAGAQYWTVKYLTGSEKVRQAAAEALERTSWKPDQSEAGTAYWIVRHQWDKCVQIGVSAVGPLFVKLQENDENVRKAAAEALVQIGKPAVELLVSALEEYYEWTYTDASSLLLRINAATVLGQIGDPRAIKVLIAMGSKVERTDEHRRAAAHALGLIGEPAIETLVKMLSNDSANLQQLAAWSLGHSGDTRAVEHLIPMLSTIPFHYPHVRQASREALKAITGQDFGQNVAHWQDWWREYAPGGEPHAD